MTTPPISPKPPLRRFHQARWDEPLIFQLGSPGERGVIPPPPGPSAVRPALPPGMRRDRQPDLPEISQMHVLRHYLRLSQETLGVDLNVDIGQGTCTMKYSPKINDDFVAMPEVSQVHPLQDESTVQGLLQLLYELERMLCEVSGMDRFTLQPGAGSAAIYTNVRMLQAYHATRGEDGQRDEIVTTIFSHPSNAACARTAGYKVITLYPDEQGYPDLEALEAVLSERTAALLITNPEDTGIFNPLIDTFVARAHQVGALACYDQANANGILGITRARDAGFDLCHFNLHKTFSTPHACGGPAAGACGVTAELAAFLPRPTVEFDGQRYWLDDDRPDSIGKVRPFYGVTANLVRAYAWIMSLGAEGLLEVARTAVLNNNYLMRQLLRIEGLSAPYAQGRYRVEQVRYSWQDLTEATGIHSTQIGDRASDFGVHYWTSHHPFVVPEPATIEPSESYSKADLDEYAAILARIADEARNSRQVIELAPHNAPIHQIDHDVMGDPDTWAPSWRAYRRKYLGADLPTPPRHPLPPDRPPRLGRDRVRHR